MLKNKGELEKTPKSKGTKVTGPRKGQGSAKKYFKKHQTTKAREASKSKKAHKLWKAIDKQEHTNQERH